MRRSRGSSGGATAATWPFADILDGKADFDLGEMLQSIIEVGRGRRGGSEGGRRGPYRRPGPGWHTFDRDRYIGVFAERLGIRPWEIGLLSVGGLRGPAGLHRGPGRRLAALREVRELRAGDRYPAGDLGPGRALDDAGDAVLKLLIRLSRSMTALR